ncbi:MAG: hypothetical protein PHW59_09495, partial [Desulfobacterales bacterium]|nr:hypothetical protein [Desulfobacterales bacterium]
GAASNTFIFFPVERLTGCTGSDGPALIQPVIPVKIVFAFAFVRAGVPRLSSAAASNTFIFFPIERLTGCAGSDGPALIQPVIPVKIVFAFAFVRAVVPRLSSAAASNTFIFFPVERLTGCTGSDGPALIQPVIPVKIVFAFAFVRAGVPRPSSGAISIYDLAGIGNGVFENSSLGRLS